MDSTPSSSPREARSFVRDLTFFVCAVLVGSAGGLLARQLMVQWFGSVVATNAALAVATTLTGATHSRLVHNKPLADLVPQILVGAPAAYAAMRAIHALLGS